jgi:FlaA1/EpsC-like NDP-sugar epimerase
MNRIDWREFLARPPLPPPSPEIGQVFAQTRFLITGAGGSIGSALALRLAQSGSSRTVLLDSSENNLHQLQQALAGVEANAGAAFVLGDAGDVAALEEIFFAYRPHIVFHAAAHKHVPLLELQPYAAIANNIFVTETLVAAAAKHGASVLLLSTDKAVQPASVMGATKRIAEEIVLRGGGAALRLGNVLASSGSVTEIFARQAMRGGPLTVTDSAARRYFLTMEEAVNLLLQAAHIAASVAADKSSAALLAPSLAADHGIAELAAFLARKLGDSRELPVHFIGLRPGDKLAERLWDDGERTSPAKDGLLFIHSVHPEPTDFASGLSALRAAVRERDLTTALAHLRALVPGFRPSETVLALAQKSAQRVYA